jgi:hypothetical protein
LGVFVFDSPTAVVNIAPRRERDLRPAGGLWDLINLESIANAPDSSPTEIGK